METRLQQLQHELKKENIKVDNEWLTGCVEYFLSNDANISLKDLHKEAISQWLLTDLNEISMGCLPDTVNTKKESFYLTGKYPLQIQYIIDISESPYDQLRNLYNKVLDETSEEKQERQSVGVKRKRLLKIEFSDGRKTVYGMEYKPISILHTKLSPGCKVMLSGSIRCVNKVLFLSPENITLLGGEVEHLQITYAYENVLLRLLNLPLKDNPHSDYKETIPIEQPQIRSNAENIPAIYDQTAAQNNQLKSEFDENDDIFFNVNFNDFNEENGETVTAIQQNNNNQMKCSFNEDDDDDDDLMLAENLATNLCPPLPGPSASTTTTATTIRSVKENNRHEIQRNVNETFKNNVIRDYDPEADGDFMDDTYFDEIENDIRLFNAVKTPLQHDINNTRITTTVSNPEIKTNAASTSTITPSILSDNYEYKIFGHNLITIDEICALDVNQRIGKIFIIKSRIDSVFEKIRIQKVGDCCEWTLGVILIDDISINTIQVYISRDVLEELSGRSTSELYEMKYKTHEAKIKNELMTILTKLQCKLISLNCFMKLSFIKDSHPVIVQIIPSEKQFEEIHNNKLKMLNK